MIKARPALPLVVQSKARVKAWLASQPNDLRTKLATEAGVHEKTLRLARSPDWNPTADTLSKLEAIIPHGWQPEAKRARAA